MISLIQNGLRTDPEMLEILAEEHIEQPINPAEEDETAEN